MELQLSQKQSLSASLQTSMHLLQLNNLQLRNYIGELMTSNAVVELEYPELDYHPGPFEQQRHFQRVSRQNDHEQELSKEQLMVDRASLTSTRNDLFLQSAAMNLSEQHSRILDYLIHSLDENGFLPESASSISRTLHAPEEEIVFCIRQLQSMEPAGIGAANLSECLCLQLQRITPQDTVALQIVQSYLEELAKAQYSVIAKALHVPKAQVMESCERIRSLHPKPLNGQSSENPTPYILPDFYVIEDNGQLCCQMNDYYLPKITIDPYYKELIASKELDSGASEYLKKNYQQANEIIKFLSYRKSTLQRVVEYVLSVQKDFFFLGPGHRVAMSNREIAQALELHESTVSRAVNGKFFECKWGVFPLKSLFLHSTAGESGDPGSYDQVLQLLQELIAAEPEKHPYSDQALAALLEERGFPIARRTVAKYRQQLGIPTAGKRKKTG